MRDCERYQEWLSAMLDGELDERQERELQAHLDGCAECRALFAAFTDISGAVAAEAVEDIPEDLHARVMAKIDLSAKVLNRQKKLRILRPVLSMAAGLIVVVGSLLALRGSFVGRSETSRTPMMNTNTAASAYSVQMNEMEKAESPLIDQMMVAAEAPAEAVEAEPMPESADETMYGAYATNGAQSDRNDAEAAESAVGGAEPAAPMQEPRATAAPEDGLLHSAGVVSRVTVAYGDDGSAREFTDPADVASLLALLDGLTPEETGTSAAEETERTGCVITLYDADGKTVLTCRVTDGVLRTENGDRKTLSADETAALQRLLEADN